MGFVWWNLQAGGLRIYSIAPYKVGPKTDRYKWSDMGTPINGRKKKGDWGERLSISGVISP